MLYRKLGNTGEEVSILGFGCMRLPVIDKNPADIDEEKARKMLRHAIDNGVNYIDTAYPYHGTGFDKPGESEPFVGRALQDGYRQKVKLATKLPSWLVQSREDMDRFLDEQLKRLQTDHIDFYLVHTLNKNFWENLKKHDVFDFLDKAIADGRIRYAGFSYHDDKNLFKEIVDAYDWSFCQIQYNYLDENYQAGREGLEYAASKGLGIVIMEPLRGGNLADRLPQFAKDIFKKTDPEKTPVDWALRWLWNHREISVILSGMTEVEHVVENLKIASDSEINAMSDEELETVNKVKKAIKERTKVNCTACGYCMPCPIGINIPSCFQYYNNYFMFDDMGTKMMSKMMYSRLPEEARADKCIECGKCESHCPQNIEIRKHLKDVVETLKEN